MFFDIKTEKVSTPWNNPIINFNNNCFSTEGGHKRHKKHKKNKKSKTLDIESELTGGDEDEEGKKKNFSIKNLQIKIFIL